MTWGWGGGGNRKGPIFIFTVTRLKYCVWILLYCFLTIEIKWMQPKIIAFDYIKWRTSVQRSRQRQSWWADNRLGENVKSKLTRAQCLDSAANVCKSAVERWENSIKSEQRRQMAKTLLTEWHLHEGKVNHQEKLHGNQREKPLYTQVSKIGKVENVSYGGDGEGTAPAAAERHWVTARLAGPLAVFLKIYILLIVLLQLSHFPPFIPLHPPHPLSPTFTAFSSCPWVVHVSSLASTFPILF